MLPESTDLSSRSPVWFRQPEVLHAGTYVVIALAAVVEAVHVVAGGGGAMVLGSLLLTVAGAALAWWHPWPGLLLAVAGCVIAATAGWLPLVEWSITVFTLFSFTLKGRPAVRGTLVTGATLYAAVVIAERYDFLSITAFTAMATAMAAGAIGSALRIHQQYWRSLEQRAADAIATRDIEATRRVAEERLRIARDLHDVVGHQIAVVSMHLGIAEVSLPPEAHPARAALASARTAVRSVLTETQRILYVLRRGTPDDDGALHPAPDLARLPELIDSFQRIGLRVKSTIDEMPREIDPIVSVTIFRIVQEALTNAHRHGNGTAEVSVTIANGHILIDVANGRRRDGTTRHAGSGYGLLGMRERVSSAGGRLTVIDDDGDRFQVSVTLMTDGSNVR
ncbi:histidine kinase [Acrocarpospora macrocephala]|uniref:histidine kinase n=1 Tax=Acrocarpospora macrocephala TaxID=150177 RepID=A0A5M3WXJ6_9ACTN|nr:histidine kinase [Acrocarpospora macrocephala]GES12041.1 two-component sensor histidine kinase [Acrocarpospora macrocephala]